ncbi:Phospholipase D3, partial [Exaiptasia diaphana]
KIFEAYWVLATLESHIPKSWPSFFHTGINVDTPANITINGSRSTGIFLSSSPKQLCPPGRTVDIDAILNIIGKAEKFVYIEVMDYFPTTLYLKHNTYWPVIDDALRKAAFDRGVVVRLLAGLWNHTRPDLKRFLKSLSAINGSKYGDVIVETKFFQVPSYSKAQKEIPFARVNHDKFMVTDKTAYVGTSNWAADYFIGTGGIGYVINDQSNDFIRRQLQSVFERDWNSKYIVPVQ